MDIYLILIIIHIVGTILGVGGATLIEVHLNKALADGQMSPDERGLLGLDFTVVRIGLILALFSGIGFIAYYMTTTAGPEVRLQNPVFWAKMAMVVIVAVNALLLQAHKIGMYWGSAFSFVTWWGAAILGIFLTQGFRAGFIEIMLVYIALIVAGAFILHRIREFIKSKHA